ncbi:MAG: adenosylhomocysteinase, partial [Micromonosporaceae bacterium]
DAPRGVPVFAWKAETIQEYWWCTDQVFRFPGGQGPNSIVDDGGDATLLVHLGARFEAKGGVPAPVETDSPDYREALRLLTASLAEDGQRFTRIAAGMRGVSEETSAGVTRLYQVDRVGELLFPAVNVNDSVTKSKFDNKYGIRHSLIDGLNRATDVMLAGKLAVVCGYGDVGKGAVEALRGQGARVVVTEVDPICALQAAMAGLPVVRLDDVVEDADLVITTTGNTGVVLVDHLVRMKHQAIVGNVGHFDDEIDMAGLAKVPGIVRMPIKPQVDEWRFPDGHSVIVLSEGRLLNLGNATGHPSFVMSASFANQTLAQIELFTTALGVRVHLLPKVLDEKVARLHLDALGARLTEMRPDQAAYIGVPVQGPYKQDHYRY